MSLTRKEAIAAAKKAAENFPEQYTKVDGFEPHEWVIQAVIEASTDARKEGYDEGYNEGYDEGYEDGSYEGGV
jgi:flagellar biosynthesis/type III secretory pathway protein FliH